MKKLTLLVQLLVLILACFSNQSLNAQKEVNKPSVLRHHMSPEEATLKHLIGMDARATEAPDGPVTNIAEFDKMQSVLIRYSFGISYELIAEMSQECTVTTIVSTASDQTYVTNQYTTNGANLDNCNFIIAPSNSYWTRDYGPWFIFDGNNEMGVMDFTYNRPRPYDNAIPSAVAEEFEFNLFEMDIITAGGNYMTDGMGISASSDLIWSENPGHTQAEIDEIFEDYLGIHTYHVLDDPNNTYIDHIDCWGKFLDVDKVLIRSVPESHAQYDELEATASYFENQISSYGNPYQVIRVYTPNDQPYSNSLILNKRVFVPIMNSQWDDEALATYQEAMPGYEVLGFTGSWQSTDALHCRAKGIAHKNMLHITHFPLLNEQPVLAAYPIEATLRAFSGQAIYSDAVKIHFRINGAEWQTANLINSEGLTWEGNIPGVVEGSQVEYYISAADVAGNEQNHPFIGMADPHVFFVGEQAFAQINVQPAGLNVSAGIGQTTETSINISNTGALELNFSIETSSTQLEILDYAIDDSPSASSYDYNTYTELGWTELEVEEMGEIAGFEITFSWDTDTWAYEGTLMAESPTGTQTIIAEGFEDGTYTVDATGFNGEEMAGTWKVWIEDSYGDGGHQATSIIISITRITSQLAWLGPVNPSNGTITAGDNIECLVPCSAAELGIGTYQGLLSISSNDPDYPVIEIPVTFEVTGNVATTQCISLDAGWNLMSARVVPSNTDMLNVVQPLIEDNLLFKVLDEAGGSIFHLPVPPPNGQWTNSIGDLETTEGYYIKVVEDAELCIEGLVVETPLDIPLTEGWNIISYPCEFPQNALDVVQPLIDEGSLYKVIDESGGTIFHLPYPLPNGQWTNSIGDFNGGEGYYLKVTENTSLSISCPTGPDKLHLPNQIKAEPIHFFPTFEGNPYMPMHIILHADESIQAGDEIGIFDGDVCVGASVFDGVYENPMVITTSMDDVSTEKIDGFVNGNSIHIKSIDHQNGTISETPVIAIQGSDTFEALGTFVGEIQSFSTGINNSPTVTERLELAPNPFTDKTFLSVSLSQNSYVAFQVLENCGTLVNEFSGQFLSKGTHTIEIDLSNKKQGIYFLIVETRNQYSNNNYTRKIIKL